MTEKKNESDKGKEGLWRTIEQQRLGRLTENERNLIETIQSLDSRYQNLLVIVEGKRDALVLRNLGLKAPIIKSQTGLSRPRLLNKILTHAGKDGQVLILTDFDKKGKEIYSFIETELELSGIKNLKRERRIIRKYMEHWTTIEQLVALLKKSDSPEASF
ncbi:MAG: toprim domain-containing protein [Candidatus Thorarchaeota archaeon]